MKHLLPSIYLATAIAAMAPIHPAEAAIFIFNANLSGPNEAPPNASPGTGTATVTLDDTLHTMRIQTTFSLHSAG